MRNGLVDYPPTLGYSHPMAARGNASTYRAAGVDIAAADRLVTRIASLAATTRRREVLSGVGPFAAAFRLPGGMRHPVLFSSCDGVGTKLDVARLAGDHSTVGIDLVAMNANDLITAGAEPLFFLDYLSAGKLASIAAEQIVAGIAEGCRQSGMSLVGGETAELPGFYPDGSYDLAGFCVGVAERSRILDPTRVRPGDAIIGLASDGLHSNGYSLARKALKATTRKALDKHVPELGCSLAEELLKPTRIYVRPVLAALQKFPIRAMAHITGGGIPGNLVRSLPDGVQAVIERSAIPTLPVFELIRDRAGVRRPEMDRTFNCGIGYTMIVPARQAEELCRFLGRRQVRACILGEVMTGPRRVRYAR